MIAPELQALAEANAWTFGPCATALRILKLTYERGADPETFWEPLLAGCPRMAPLGYWLAAARQGGWKLEDLERDYLRRESMLVAHLYARVLGTEHVLLVGHDREIDRLLSASSDGSEYRYLLLEGAEGAVAPGSSTRRRFRPGPARMGPPFEFARLEEALDWCDVVVLAGFVMHRQNLLGPPQLRPLLMSARDQAEAVLLTATNERRLTLGEGSPRQYRDDFRPYLWQSSVTHLVTEWYSGAEGTALGWLPLPPDVLSERFGEEFFGT